MKKTLNIFLIAFIFIGLLNSCKKDKELSELEWVFSVDSPNKDIKLGLEVGQIVDLSYFIKKDYNNGAELFYEITNTTTNFSVFNENNELVELNKQYALNKDTLNLKYQGFSKGEQQFTIKFTNSKGYKVEKSINLNFDGFGITLHPIKDKFQVGNVIAINYQLIPFKNKKTDYIIKVIEDELDGEFRFSKNGTPIAKKGDSFELINTTSENQDVLYYYTKNYTQEGKAFDKIILEVSPKNSIEEQKQIVTLNYNFEKPNVFFKIEKETSNTNNRLVYNVIINDVNRENNKYVLDALFYSNFNEFSYYHINSKILYNGKVYEMYSSTDIDNESGNKGKIVLEGAGTHQIEIIPDSNYLEQHNLNKGYFLGTLNYLDTYTYTSSELEVDLNNIWIYPTINLTFNINKAVFNEKIFFKLNSFSYKGSSADYKLKIVVESDYLSIPSTTYETTMNVIHPNFSRQIFDNMTFSSTTILVQVFYQNNLILSHSFTTKDKVIYEIGNHNFNRFNLN